MEEEPKNRRRRILDDVEEIVGDVSKVVRVAVIRGSEAAESVGENLKETIKDTIHGGRSARDSVVMVRQSCHEKQEQHEGNPDNASAGLIVVHGGPQSIFSEISNNVN